MRFDVLYGFDLSTIAFCIQLAVLWVFGKKCRVHINILGTRYDNVIVCGFTKNGLIIVLSFN